MQISELCKESHRISKAHGFWDGDKCVPSKLMLVVSELGEAMEDDRIGSSKIGEELGDAMIRIADLAEYLGIDLDKEIVRKMKINETRPRLHGKRY
ncbi:MAG: nucleotide pyrophosphohydrolase [Actinobacteria bacterium]|nr:nucleotide pyrophosphohydrolase [Actinomycetota bacterium]MBE3114811.1 nucleotide pyrophosphohydrolase [Actinomycetota bacterium]